MTFRCNHCNTLIADKETVGSTGPCPHCGEQIVYPFLIHVSESPRLGGNFIQRLKQRYIRQKQELLVCRLHLRKHDENAQKTLEQDL